MVLLWGPERVLLCNEGYLPLHGRKDSALGMACEAVWPEIWPTVGPMLRGVLAGGSAKYVEDHLLLMERHGFPEECFLTWSYSPIRDEDGRVGGVFCAVTETTALGECAALQGQHLTDASAARTPTVLHGPGGRVALPSFRSAQGRSWCSPVGSTRTTMTPRCSWSGSRRSATTTAPSPCPGVEGGTRAGGGAPRTRHPGPAVPGAAAAGPAARQRQGGLG